MAPPCAVHMQRAMAQHACRAPANAQTIVASKARGNTCTINHSSAFLLQCANPSRTHLKKSDCCQTHLCHLLLAVLSANGSTDALALAALQALEVLSVLLQGAIT